MSEKDSEILLAVKVWAAAAWADGVIVEQEANAMKAFLSVAKLNSAEVQTALGWLEDKVELDDVNVAGIPEDNRLNIFSAALGVVSIDKTVTDSEEKFLDRLRAALGIDEGKAESMRQSIDA